MSGLRGYLLYLACYFAFAFALLPVVVVTAGSSHSQITCEPEFIQSPKDRPVLESVHQVWHARTTGVSEFDFDGMHYVITNLPKHYVDYSSWYVRMP